MSWWWIGTLIGYAAGAVFCLLVLQPILKRLPG